MAEFANLKMAYQCADPDRLETTFNVGGVEMRRPTPVPNPSQPFLELDSSSAIMFVPGRPGCPPGILVFVDISPQTPYKGTYVRELSPKSVQISFRPNERITREGEWIKAEMQQFKDKVHQIVTEQLPTFHFH